MYQLSYCLRILVVQLMNEQVWTNSIVECYQENLVIHLIHQQSFSIKMADKSTQAFIFSLFYVQHTRQGRLLPLSPNKVVDEQLT